MPDALRRDVPPRTEARARLAACMERHAAATARAERVDAARARLDRQLFDVLLPAVPEAEQALRAARAQAPRALVTALLGDGPPARSAVADCEVELRRAETAVEEARSARDLLDAEARHADDDLTAARHQLDGALRGAVAADPARAALEDAFVAAAKRALRLAMALKTAGIGIGNVDAHGQRLIVANVPVPLGGLTAFAPDPAWQRAIAALATDPDAEMPGLPADDDDPDDGDAP